MGFVEDRGVSHWWLRADAQGGGEFGAVGQCHWLLGDERVDSSVAAGIAAAVDDLESRNDISIAILTGAGGTFCAGMDLKAFVRGESPSIPGRGFAGLTESPPTFSSPDRFR
jgi:hypothetical protein